MEYVDFRRTFEDAIRSAIMRAQATGHRQRVIVSQGGFTIVPAGVPL